MFRVSAAAFLALALLAGACSPEAATSRGELGSGQAEPRSEPAPEPTVASADVGVDPAVVIEPTPTPEGPAPLVVATLLGETGVMATLDGPALAGIVTQIDLLNEEGGLLGRPIELRRFDTASRASLAERHAGRLADNPPDLIITSCDTEFSSPALEIADAAGILTISPCADDVRYLTGGLGARNFTLGAPAEQRGALAAAVGIESYGATALVLRDVTSPEALAFCDGFERAFRELGGAVVYRDEFSYDTLEPLQDRLAERGRESDFITLCSHVPGGLDAAPSIILNLRILGFGAPILAGTTLDETTWFQDVPTLGEMTFISWSSTFGNDPNDQINEIIRRVQQNGETPGAGVTTILGAQTIEAWARAVNAARDPAPDRVTAALGSFNDEVFATGGLSFVAGARMDLGRTYRVMRVIDGELSVVALEETEN